MRVDFNDYRLTWGTSYIGPVRLDPKFADPYGDISDIPYTCLGPDFGDLLCKGVDFAPSYVTHSLSLYYRGDSWTLGGGVRNLFDKAPPVVDGFQVLAVNNAPLGYGYDLNGRRLFLTLGKKF